MSTDVLQLKRETASYVVSHFIEPDMVLGVGTGSTVAFLIEALKGKWDQFSAVLSSSEQTTAHLKKCGAVVTDPNAVQGVDLYVDGADEVSSLMYLSKGGGGALTREKILAHQAKRFVCVVDESKMVQVLGKFPLSVEVLPCARSFVSRELLKLTAGKGLVCWREGLITDNGGQIIDVKGLLIEKPLALEHDINQIPGVIANGIFAQLRPSFVVCAGANGIRVLSAGDESF